MHTGWILLEYLLETNFNFFLEVQSLETLLSVISSFT